VDSTPHPCYNPNVNTPETLALEVHRRLLETYGHPVWRNRLPPMDELISTILSQNTNDTNRDRAFASLRAAFPSWEAVRDARPAAVIEAIQIAGLANQKGPRIQAILQQLTQERGSLDLAFLQELSPEEAHAALVRFRGVGPKTAAIVMLFSLDMPAFPVDTHIYRVTGRLGLRPPKITAEKAHTVLGQLFAEDSYYAVHLNLIRHGREVCHARQPSCDQCPLQDICPYFEEVFIKTKLDRARE
jgi:endonuclease-3